MAYANTATDAASAINIYGPTLFVGKMCDYTAILFKCAKFQRKFMEGV